MNDYMCNLLVPGFPKSGTTSLHEYLDQHDSICMSRPKEYHYFSRNDVWEKGKEAHNLLFQHCSGDEQWYGESSTLSCVWDEAINRIGESLNNPKAILLLRHPVDRAVSHYRWLFRLGQERNSFRKAIVKYGGTFDPERPIGNYGNHKGYIKFSRYATYVPRWRNTLGRENVLVICSEKLRSSPDVELEKVWSFLGLPALHGLKHRVDNTTNAIPPSGVSFSRRLMRKSTSRGLRKKLFNYKIINSIWGGVSAQKKQLVAPVISDEDRGFLSGLLKDDIEFYNSVFRL